MSPPKDVIDQAAHWLVKIEEQPLSPSDLAQLNAWRQQHPHHEQAWQAAMQLKGMIGQVSNKLGKRVLARERIDRRAVLKTLVGLAILAPASKLAWDAWPALTADYRTAAGEQRDITLPDGSRLQLNTATKVDVQFSQTERVLRLIEGEMLITTAPDVIKRPFVVATQKGRVRALGTRFSVRDTNAESAMVTLYEHAVAVRPALQNQETRVEAGQTLRFSRDNVAKLQSHDRESPAWLLGQIISSDQRLGDFIADLARYRPGILRCDPAVADLRISGVFQLKDTDQVLDIVAGTLPVRIHRATDYWVTVTGR